MSSKFECRIRFNVLVQNNNLLTYQDHLKKRQIVLYKLITFMKEERGMGYRKISKWLNHSGITTHEGNTWGETGNSVYSVIKRMKEREQRLIQSNQNFSSQITEFKIGE